MLAVRDLLPRLQLMTACSRRAPLTSHKDKIGDNHELWETNRRSQSPFNDTSGAVAPRDARPARSESGADAERRTFRGEGPSGQGGRAGRCPRSRIINNPSACEYRSGDVFCGRTVLNSGWGASCMLASARAGEYRRTAGSKEIRTLPVYRRSYVRETTSLCPGIRRRSRIRFETCFASG